MSDRIGTLKNKLNYISPINYRPTKEMLEKYENLWLPLRKKIQDKKKDNKKFFLLYGDFDIIEIKNNYIFPDTKKNISNPKSNRSSKKNSSNSSTKKKSKTNSSSKKQAKVVKGKKRSWTICNK
jgi:hypothetical protein